MYIVSCVWIPMHTKTYPAVLQSVV